MVKRMTRVWTSRTFKRELAVISLLFWAMLTMKVFFFSSVEFINALGTAYGTASASIWLYVMGAFALDAAGKQLGSTNV